MICITCSVEKPVEEYEFNKNKKTYRRMCKKCKNIQTMEARYNTTEAHLKRKLSRLKGRAKECGFEFDLTYKDLCDQLEKQDFKCFYTDMPLVFYKYKKIPARAVAPSIDKIDPSKGYTKDNIVWCLERINRIKQDLTLDEMEKWTPDWYKRIVNKA